MRKRAQLLTGQYLYVDPFEYVGGKIAQEGCYEPETVALFRSILTRNMVIIDAGAHVGQYTVIASALVGSSGQVHAFEPDPFTFQLLKDNAIVNRCLNTLCNRGALSSDRGHGLLYLSDVSFSASDSLRPPRGCEKIEAVEVELIALDEYVKVASLHRVDVLKADVEGAELLVLRGARETIVRFTPIIIVELSVHTERFGYRKEDLKQQLEEWGYHLFRVGRTPLRPYTPSVEEPTFFNVLAVHEDQVQSFASKGIIESCVE